MMIVERKCPHDRIQDCPLYACAHFATPGLPSCLTRDISDGRCDVDAGSDYSLLVLAVQVKFPAVWREIQIAQLGSVTITTQVQ